MSTANPTSQGPRGAGLGQPELCEWHKCAPTASPVGLEFEGSAGAVGTLANKAEPRVAFLGHSVSGPFDPHELMTWPLHGEQCLVPLPRPMASSEVVRAASVPPGGRGGLHLSLR